MAAKSSGVGIEQRLSGRPVRKERTALIQSLEIATRKAGALGARLDATIGSLLDVNRY